MSCAERTSTKTRLQNGCHNLTSSNVSYFFSVRFCYHQWFFPHPDTMSHRFSTSAPFNSFNYWITFVPFIIACCCSSFISLKFVRESHQLPITCLDTFKSAYKLLIYNFNFCLNNYTSYSGLTAFLVSIPNNDQNIANNGKLNRYHAIF